MTEDYLPSSGANMPPLGSLMLECHGVFEHTCKPTFSEHFLEILKAKFRTIGIVGGRPRPCKSVYVAYRVFLLLFYKETLTLEASILSGHLGAFEASRKRCAVDSKLSSSLSIIWGF